MNLLAMNYRFYNVKKKRMSSHDSSFYKPYSRFVLSTKGIHDLAHDDILSKIQILEHLIPKFDKLPRPAQFSLMDIAFQGFKSEPARARLIASVNASDWAGASAEIYGLYATTIASKARTAWRVSQMKSAGNRS
jgi:hypothetical protein